MRYVLRFQGQGAKPAADVAQVRRLPGVTVLEETSRMLLVEGDDQTLPPLVDTLSGWVLSPEQTYKVPDPRRRLGEGS